MHTMCNFTITSHAHFHVCCAPMENEQPCANHTLPSARPFFCPRNSQMTTWDLTSTMTQYLDRHLIFPLLGHLESQTHLFAPLDLLKSKFALLSDTSMVDSSIDIYKELNPGADEPAGECVP